MNREDFPWKPSKAIAKIRLGRDGTGVGFNGWGAPRSLAY